jgi:phage baseplate assembly protein W
MQSFKNVGIKAVLGQTILERNRTQRPIGLKTPMKLDFGTSEVFEMNFTFADQVKDNLRNLLLTNHGERLALSNFGANIRPLLTEFSNKADFDSESMIRINTAVQAWMPFVNLLGFDSVPDYTNNEFTGRIRILIEYSVPTLRIEKDLLEMTLFVI